MGSDGDADSNFIQLLHLQGMDCPKIEHWLKKKNNKYAFHVIQNGCLQDMSLHIVREVSKRIHDNACYTIMADECSDVSNKEQFTIIIRWVGQDLRDHEDFIGLTKLNISVPIAWYMPSRTHFSGCPLVVVANAMMGLRT